MRKFYIFRYIVAIMLLNITSNLAQVDQNKIDWGIHPMDYSSVGTYGWQFLKLPNNARSAAMGNVISPISHGDANSALTNPASISDIGNMSFSINHMNWVADIRFSSLSFVKKFDDWGTFGLNLVYVDYGTEPRTEYLETQLVSSIIYTPVFEGLGTVGAHDLSLGLSYSKRITDKLQVGGTIKYLSEQIDDAETSTWAFDIGTVFYTGFKSLRISMLGKNFGPDAEFRKYKNRIQKVPYRIQLPMILYIGTAMDVLEYSNDSPYQLIVACDYVVPDDTKNRVNFGTEFTYDNTFILRGGYRFNYDEESLSLGAGVNYSLNDYKLKVDYAFLDVGLFGSVHMFSIGVGFN